MNELQEAIKQIISDELRGKDHPILVWYDEDGSFKDVIFDCIPEGVNFLPYTGSYLVIRAKIEREDPEFKRKWLIYVPEKPVEPSWIRDYELFGKKVEMNLEKLLVNYFRLESDLELKDLLAGERGRLLASKWEEVMGSVKIPLRKEQVINGLLSIAFNLGINFSLGRAILEYVTYTMPKQELLRLGLHDVFVKMVKTKLGLDIKVEPERFEEALASALLFSELVYYSKGLGERKFSNLLPKKDKIEIWAKLAREWLEHGNLKHGFINWSKELAKKYDLKSELYSVEKLLNVMSFSAVDEALLEELKARISTGPEAYRKNLGVIEKVAIAREKSPWAIRGKINVWQIIKLSSQLYSLAERSISLMLKNKLDAGSLLHNYAIGGWWRIDSLYRKLFAQLENVEEELWKTFVKPSFNLYTSWIRMFTEQFSKAVEGLKEWKIEGFLNQQDFWNKIVEKSDKPLAVFLVDALRYELAKEIEKELSKKGYEIKLIPMLSSLPSITEVGMASLLPHASLTAKVEKGKLSVFIDKILVGRRETRQKFLEEKYGKKVLILDLNEILKLGPRNLKEKMKGYDYIVVMDRDIDLAGTYLLEISPSLFQDLTGKIIECADVLHKSGLKTVVISTDHGFLLIPKEEVNVVEGLKAEEEVDKKRRYAIGKVFPHPSLILFKLKQAWLEGEGEVAFPRGLSCLSAPGPVPIFLHGGLSPQENCIATIISRAKIEVGKVKVKAEIPDEITTAIFLVNLIPLPTPEADKPRIVKVEVWSDGKMIAESEPIELQKEAKKSKVTLRELPEKAEVRIVDVETFEILRSKEVKISIAGYAEEI